VSKYILTYSYIDYYRYKKIDTVHFCYSGGLKTSSLIRSQLISAHIPFLPLERDHVIRCIREAITSRGTTSEKIIGEITQQVMSELNFGPSKEQPIFSTTGCKQINEKVNLALKDFDIY